MARIYGIFLDSALPPSIHSPFTLGIQLQSGIRIMISDQELLDWFPGVWGVMLEQLAVGGLPSSRLLQQRLGLINRGRLPDVVVSTHPLMNQNLLPDVVASTIQ